ncbi:MAG: OmcA/MtrC family decaheme c-type cytochrome [Planctomycetota bacterium]|jgi:OmcA/MtrC family decaheme c-type cytochrome
MGSYKNSTKRVAALMLTGLLIAGCGGSDGAAGSAGPPGPPGPSTGNGIPVTSAEKINVAITSVLVPAGGGAPTVELTLRNDLNQGLVGLPAANIRFVIAQLTPGTNGGSSEWQSYITQEDGGVTDAQATTETATAGTYVDNNDGTYQYTFANALTAYPAGPVFDQTKTHRVGIEIRTNTGGFLPENIPADNAPFDFLPTGGAPIFTRLIVDSDTCNACHDNLEMHGEARFDVEYCVQCHNPSSVDGDTGNSVDMKRLIHNIHSARANYQIIGFGGRLHEWSTLEWPQDIRNCQTCHDEDNPDTLQASNWRLVANRAACGTCHYDDGIPASGHDFAIEDGVHPFGLAFDNDTFCLDCHGPDGTVTNPEGRLVQIPIAHEILEDTAAEAFEYQVVSIIDTAPGQMPTASIRVLNPTDPNYATDPASTAYDINDPAGPFQTGSARLRMDISWTTDDLGNLDPNDDLARSATSGAPFAPIAVDFKSGAVNDGTNTFTKTASAAIPTGITGSGLAILEGRPQVDIGGSLKSIKVAASGIPFGITDATPQDRRKVVDIGKCNDCHKDLAMHGDNRSGNTEVCSTCHNPNATDIDERLAASECDTELGLDDEPIDLKRMIHGIHSGAVGLCGHNNSAHSYFGLVYPGRLNNCEGCHLADTYYPVDPAAVLATTIDVGADRSTLTDDVAISPNTAVCSSCHEHQTTIATEHITQNGGDFTAGKDDTGAMISFSLETCEVCHGPGRTADVKVMHKVETFEFN